ncbi:hypothetical protein HOLleu_22197 [Holothuria leucospilota]|uniref:Uncharacterized protein n=1 Tax=Holothuria leucospilota TaxID=206669 RepID=A0A9Q1BYY1_HOLLE|nr:hypothetical protein HOLleu_22197 [Holothuria leucospilota]
MMMVSGHMFLISIVAIKQTTCEKFGDRTGKWSNGEFSCEEILCSYDTLPSAINGFVSIFDCSRVSVGGKCNITCFSNFFPTYPGYVTCGNNGSHVGTWSNNSFSCFGYVTCENNGSHVVTWSNNSFSCFAPIILAVGSLVRKEPDSPVVKWLLHLCDQGQERVPRLPVTATPS